MTGGTPSADLAILLHSAAFDRVHYGFVLAAAGAATNRSVVMFFAGASVGLLGPRGQAALTGAEAEAGYRDRGIADLATLIDSCAQLRVRFLACELALKAQDLTPGALRADLSVEVTGAVSFLNTLGPGTHSLSL